MGNLSAAHLFRKWCCNPLTRPASRDTLSPKEARAVVMISCFGVDAVRCQLCAEYVCRSGPHWRR